MRYRLPFILGLFLFTNMATFAISVDDFALPMLDRLEPLMEKNNPENSLEPLKQYFTLQIPVTKQFFQESDVCTNVSPENTRDLRNCPAERFTSATGCKAYALNEHWLLAGATCFWNGRHNVEIDNLEYKTGLVQADASRPLKIAETEIPLKNNLFVQPHENFFPHVILVHVPNGYPQLTERLRNTPKMRILTFSQSNPFKLLQGAFFIHTSRLGTDNISQHTLLADSLKNGAVTVEEKSSGLSGTSTDPLAFLRNDKLYWLGINEGVTEIPYGNLAGKWKSHPSADYFYFTEADKQFIEDTIFTKDPQSWQAIAPLIKVDKL